MAVATRPIVAEEVVPEANDAYVSASDNGDVEFFRGSTYIWTKGPDGRRHRNFYGVARQSG
jgi:hypothetical protein